jgi:hypothetical protein
MANRFWVGGTGTWDSTSTTHWSTTTGGSNGASAPGSGDTAIFDGSSGGGTVTVDSTINGATLQQITAGAFTGTLDFSANNPSLTLSVSLSLTGSGTRSINLGSGTFTFTATGNQVVIDCTTTTGLTATFQNASYALSGNNSGIRTINSGGQTYGSLSVGSNSSKGTVTLSGAGTYASISVSDGNIINIPQLTTVTITGALTATGTASNPVSFISSTVTANAATISVGSASTAVWSAFCGITRAGAGTLNATDSFDLGKNSSFTSITPPSGGGGGVVGVIGG